MLQLLDTGRQLAKLIATEVQVRQLPGIAQTVQGLAETPIFLPGGRHVRLADLGEVVDGYQDLKSFSRLNGDQVVTFAVFRAKGASEVSVCRNIASLASV